MTNISLGELHFSFRLVSNIIKHCHYEQEASIIIRTNENILNQLNNMTYNYRQINFTVMSDTAQCCKTIPELMQAIDYSIAHQQMVAVEDHIDHPWVDAPQTKYIVSGKRSYEAAKGYKGRKVAVLNYANNHHIGGAPYSAGAQEESLCRCSTLLPCLMAMNTPFYERHRQMYSNGQMNFMGNDDLIYTPDVVVFKTDERTEPLYPQMMPRDEWYKVNVITCAAPQLIGKISLPDGYEEAIRSRVKRILDVAAMNGNEVVILGAWGCGAFRNPIETVSRIMVELVRHYDFHVVEFALATRLDVSTSAFARALRG